MTFSTRIGVDAAKGMFLGAAIGDALGWPQELRGGLVGGKKERDSAIPKLVFRSWMRNGGHWARRYEDPVRPGEYSDDTQLLLASARACFAGDGWWDWLVNVELPTWPLYQRGGGGSVLTAAASWAEGRPPWAGESHSRARSAQKRYANAGANGVAMRIAPHVLWADNPDVLVARVFRDGITTHGHPRAVVGALTYAFVLHYAASSGHTLEFGEMVEAASLGLVASSQVAALLPKGWGDVDLFCKTWDATNQEMAELLHQVSASLDQGALSPPTATLEGLGCTNAKIYGAGTVTAAGAIYLSARFASRPEGGLLAAAFLRGGDTDTLASMTGAVLGSLHGVRWTGGLADMVQDGEYLAEVATRSAERRVTSLAVPRKPPAEARKDLRSLLIAGKIPDIREFPDGRAVTVESFEPLDWGKMRRAVLRLTDGQVVFVDVEVNTAPSAAYAPEAQLRDHLSPLANLDADNASRSTATRYVGEAGGVDPVDVVLPMIQQTMKDNGLDVEVKLWRPGDPPPDDYSNLHVPTYVVTVKDHSSITRRAGLAFVDCIVEDVAQLQQGVFGETAGPFEGAQAQQYASDGIVLPSRNLRRCASFYAQLLGANLAIRDRTVKIAPWLVLRETEDRGAESAADVILTLTAPDLDAEIKRLNVDPSSRTGDMIELRDPDGRTVRVSQREPH